MENGSTDLEDGAKKAFRLNTEYFNMMDATRWREVKILNSCSPNRRLFHGAVGALLVAVSKDGDNVPQATIKDSIDMEMVLCGLSMAEEMWKDATASVVGIGS